MTSAVTAACVRFTALAIHGILLRLDRYLLTDQNRMRSVNDIMPMIGARFYTQLDAAQMRNDVIEEDLAKVKSGTV